MKDLLIRIVLYPLLAIKIFGHGLMVFSDFVQEKLGLFLNERE